MTIEQKKELLSYCKRTGEFRWRVSRSSQKAGSIAGSDLKIPKPSGFQIYRQIRINRKSYMSHRLAWEFEKGEIPKGMQIDHKNRKPSDNRIANLRLVSQSQNNINSRRRNSSGYVGVYKHSQSRGWCAELTFKGNKIIKKCFPTKNEAIKARREALQSISALV